MTLTKTNSFLSCLLRLVLVSFIVINATLQSLGSHENTKTSPFKKGDKVALTVRVLKTIATEHNSNLIFTADLLSTNINIDFYHFRVDSFVSSPLDNVTTVYTYDLNARAPPLAMC